MRQRNKWLFAMVSVAATALAGCTVDYTVRVNNRTPRDLFVTVTQDQLVADPFTLAEATVSAGETVDMGPFKVSPTDPVRAFIRTAGDTFDAPRKIRLSAGRNTITIEDSVSSPLGRTIIEK
jgi:hypothetical protein